MLRVIALLLTVVTGFSALVYEVAWQRYLATLLGSHSEATAAVLAIFLGGLSAGYALFGTLTRRVLVRAEAAKRPPHLLRLYGVVEGSIGLYALVFPLLFDAVQALAPRIAGAGAMGFAVDVTLAALLILPPTVLMGGTIPILTQALARSLEDATRFHALVYAFNAVGAFAGALAAGFFLIPAIGLRSVMLAMSATNLAVGATFFVLGRRGEDVASLHEEEAEPPRGFASYAWVALLVGFAMMAIQTVLIRLGSISFGSSEFTFTMVVAVFVLCIAVGSFVVSALPRLRSTHLLVNQWALVAVLCLLFGRLGEAPYWAYLLRTQFEESLQTFYAYYFAVLLGILAVIGPAVALSGASLPLLFHHLRREPGSLGALAGRIYSWNTVGSLLGALLGGYALLFWVDLDDVYRLAVGALIAAAVILTLRIVRSSRLALTAALLVPACGALVLLRSWDPQLLAMGLFRHRNALTQTERGAAAMAETWSRGTDLRFYDDDPVASVAVTEYRTVEGTLARRLAVNGKGDGDTLGDYTTMALLGLLPALFAEEARDAFVIGWGTGISAGELSTLPSIRRIVVAEISPGVVEAAHWFDFASQGASRNERIEIIRSDAYRALLRSNDLYDVIVSEPSNPWVAGVEMLYSYEFLKAAQSRLREGGVHAQWLHQYEMDTETVSLVLRTYAAVFEQVAVWYGGGPDLIILGFDDPSAALDLERLLERSQQPAFAAGLRRAGVENFEQLIAHEVLPPNVVHAAGLRGPLHTLHHPRLSHEAGRAFFYGHRGRLPFTGSGEAARVGAKASLVGRYAAHFGGELPEPALADLVREACQHRVSHCGVFAARWLERNPGSTDLQQTLATAGRRSFRFGSRLDPMIPKELAGIFPSDGTPPTASVSVQQAMRATALYLSYYHHGMPFDENRLLELWSRCVEREDEAGACNRERARARRLLAGASK
jgi:predicted membrane-bound spermidine synthase